MTLGLTQIAYLRVLTMADPIVEFTERGLQVLLNPDEEWIEHVYSGFARVAISRGCPHCHGPEDKIVALEIEWLEQAPKGSGS